MNNELLDDLNDLIEHLESKRGRYIEVVSHMTRTPGSLDRHSTTRSCLVMQLETVGIAFSGAKFFLIGEALGCHVAHEVFLDLLQELNAAENSTVLVERFGKFAERHTSIRLLDDVAA